MLLHLGDLAVDTNVFVFTHRYAKAKSFFQCLSCDCPEDVFGSARGFGYNARLINALRLVLLF
jgi:hypothetical protein